jgi:hypothetical protein
MLGYGTLKVFTGQFPAPSQSRLLVRLGDMSPMAMLWAFMGASRTYTAFAGLVEVIGGVLLFVPRLTTLGAIVSAAALTNIVMLDLSYDVSVKLYSSILLVMALFLILPDAGRLANVLLFNRPVQPAIRGPFFQRLWLNRTFLMLILAFGGYVLVTYGADNYQRQRQIAQLPHTVPFYGIWQVDEFTVNGGLQPPPLTEVRWQYVIFDFPDSIDCCEPSNLGMAIQSTDGFRHLYWIRIDHTRKLVQLMKLNEAEKRPEDGSHVSFQATAQFTFDDATRQQLTLEGDLDRQHIRANLHRTSMDFILLNRGLHWISENSFWGR